MPLLVYDQNLSAAINGHAYRKFGENQNGATGGQRLIWPLGGAPSSYVWPSAAATIALTSDDPGDTGLSVLVQGIGDNGAEYEETVAVGSASTGLYFRVFRMIVLGTTINLGLIEAKHGTDTLAVIAAGDGQTQQLFSTIPAGKTLYVSGVMLALGASRGAEFQLWVNTPTSPFLKKATYYIQDTSMFIPILPYATIGPMSDWFLSAEQTQAGPVYGQLLGVLLPNQE
jgi:hypothetical protein